MQINVNPVRESYVNFNLIPSTGINDFYSINYYKCLVVDSLTGSSPRYAGDTRGMALRAGLVALSTELKTGSQRLWFTSVNGYRDWKIAPTSLSPSPLWGEGKGEGLYRSLLSSSWLLSY